MLRIIVAHKLQTTVLTLVGRLEGPWVGVLDSTWKEVIAGMTSRKVIVDLCDVTFVTPEGRQQLIKMCKHGITFQTSGCFGPRLVEEILRQCTDDVAYR